MRARGGPFGLTAAHRPATGKAPAATRKAVPIPTAASPTDVARGAGTAFLSRLGAVVEVVAQPAYVAMFGLATYGLYMVLWSAVNLAQNIFDLGMPSALQRQVPQARDDDHANDVLRAAFLLGVGPSILVAALVSIFAAPVADLLNVSAADRGQLTQGVMLFAWALPLWSIVEVGTAALRARRAFGPEIRLRIFWEQIARLVIAAALWGGGATTLGLLIAHLCSLTVTAAATLRLLSRHYKGVRLFAPLPLHTVGSLLTTGLALLPLDIVGRLLAEAPPVVLNLMFPGAAGARASGLYAIARKLSSLAQMVRMSFSYVMAPLASASARQGPAAIAQIYGFATRLSLVLTLPLSAVLIAAGPVALSPFGAEAAAAYPALVALVIARTIESVCGQATAIQSVTGTRGDPVIGSLAGIAVAIVAALALVPGGGLTGAALAVAAGLSSGTIISLAQLNRRQNLHPFAAPFARTAAITVAVSVAAGALAFAARALPPAFGIAAALLTMVAALWLSARLALGSADKASLGTLGKLLRLGRGARP